MTTEAALRRAAEAFHKTNYLLAGKDAKARQKRGSKRGKQTIAIRKLYENKCK